jgi:hypothetical protein
MTDVCFGPVSQYDTTLRPFSRPIVSISQNISAFYVN